MLKYLEQREIKLPLGFGQVSPTIYVEERVVEADNYQGTGTKVDDSTPIKDWTEVRK